MVPVAAAVVEMDVRQENGADVVHGDAESRQPPLELATVVDGPGVDEHHAFGALQHRRADNRGVAEKMKIDG